MNSNPTMSESERTMRRSFRIREHAFIQFRVLTDREYEDMVNARAIEQPSKFRNHAQLVKLEAQFRESFTMMAKAPKPFRECLDALNQKLNLLLEEQPDRQDAMREIVKGSPYTCEIGSTGIRFDSDEPLEEGAKIFIQVMLTADRHYLETAAIVKREKKPLNNDPLRIHGIAAEFVGFGEAESELLIKHLFQRESESLRMRRLQLD
ncbi:MAG: hypothetical protein AB8F65_11405 [Woeseiaceae bacterium]